jgi:hypothetical protein
MLFVEQGIAQAPQLLRSVIGFDSQPSFCLSPLQSNHPASHAPLQAPSVQVGVVMWLFEQTRPQPPQFATLLEVGVSQPSVCLFMLQSAQPVAQAPLHTPGSEPVLGGPHEGVTFCDEHMTPQPPQLLGSLARSTHAGPATVVQIACVARLHAQVPEVQIAPVGQVWPQLPQFAASVLVSTQVLLHTI